MQALLELLESESSLTTITATRRLSRRLLHEYNLQQSAKGLTSWQTPQILSWSAWIQKLWRTHCLNSNEQRTLLTSTQTLHIWQEIIEASSDALINAQATARHAQSARQLVIESNIDLGDDDKRQWFVYDNDASRWLDWYQQYIKRLQENHWVDAYDVVLELIELIINNELNIESDSLTFIGFDHFTVQQKQLKDWLNNQLVYRDINEELEQTSNVHRIAASDQQSEFRQAAYWARQQYELRQESDTAPIGIIVPQLEQYRDEIERHLRDVFYPCDVLENPDDSLHTQGIRQNSIFNISMGYSLAHQAVMRTALNILTLCRYRFSYDTFSAVLRSPFIDQSQERASIRSLLDMQMRQRLGVDTGLRQLMQHIDQDAYADEYLLIHKLDELKDSWKGAANASQWVERFQACLSLFGWPATEHSNSHQQQILRSLDDLWLEFSRQDLVQKPLSFDKALGQFTTLISSQVFQSGAAELPVQILGMIEAAGMSFSKLWVMQMTEQNWPPAANPNPFIPLSVQREHNMPHSTARREYDYATRQTQRILQSAPEIIFSYCEYLDEEAISPSPLIAEYPLLQYEVKSSADYEEVEFEYLVDDQGPEINSKTYHAGSSALKDQSHCPFRSFIHHRLHAKSPEEMQQGNDPRDRGNSVHQVLELLWKQWRTSSKLQSLDQAEIEQHVQAAVDQVIHSAGGIHNPDIEQRRLIQLTLEWLEQEKQRQPFTVTNPEKRIKADVDGLKLHLIIDRIDELEDGSQCVIDYKTGTAKASQWVGERPDEPQLPLYAVIQNKDVSAVSFANVRSGECQYQGVSHRRELMVSDEKQLAALKQIPVTKGNSILRQYDDWDGMLEEWRTTIETLAHAHRDGEARVDPVKPPDTCSYCDVGPVCRLFDWQELDDESA